MGLPNSIVRNIISYIATGINHGNAQIRLITHADKYSNIHYKSQLNNLTTSLRSD